MESPTEQQPVATVKKQTGPPVASRNQAPAKPAAAPFGKPYRKPAPFQQARPLQIPKQRQAPSAPPTAILHYAHFVRTVTACLEEVISKLLDEPDTMTPIRGIQLNVVAYSPWFYH